MSLAQLANEATDSAKHIHPHLVLNMPSVLLATLCAGHLARRTHFLGSKRSGKVGTSRSFLASVRNMSDRQSKKRRWFSYRSSYNLQSGPERNIDKKVQLFRGPLAFDPTMEDACCP